MKIELEPAIPGRDFRSFETRKRLRKIYDKNTQIPKETMKENMEDYSDTMREKV